MGTSLRRQVWIDGLKVMNNTFDVDDGYFWLYVSSIKNKHLIINLLIAVSFCLFSVAVEHTDFGSNQFIAFAIFLLDTTIMFPAYVCTFETDYTNATTAKYMTTVHILAWSLLISLHSPLIAICMFFYLIANVYPRPRNSSVDGYLQFP